MGVWGHGPTKSDHVMDFLYEVLPYVDGDVKKGIRIIPEQSNAAFGTLLDRAREGSSDHHDYVIGLCHTLMEYGWKIHELVRGEVEVPAIIEEAIKDVPERGWKEPGKRLVALRKLLHQVKGEPYGLAHLRAVNESLVDLGLATFKRGERLVVDEGFYLPK